MESSANSTLYVLEINQKSYNVVTYEKNTEVERALGWLIQRYRMESRFIVDREVISKIII